MTTTANTGPYVSFGQAPSGDGNPDAGPNKWYQGDAILDPRAPYTYSPGSNRAYGWSSTEATVLNVVPSTATTNAIAAAQVPTAGTPLTLASSTAAGITVGQTITNAATGTSVTGLLAIDGAASYLAFGTTTANRIWDPATLLSRCLRITSVGNDSTATITIKGFDAYFYPMTQTLALANAGSVVTTKAFKYILSATPAGTLSGSNVSIGQSDTIGFPLRVDYQSFATISWPQPAVITAATGFTAADMTSPATAATGDVRGTYALQTASDGTRRMIMAIRANPGTLSTTAGLLGQPQF